MTHRRSAVPYPDHLCGVTKLIVENVTECESISRPQSVARRKWVGERPIPLDEAQRGVLVADLADALELLYGLVVQDTQIRALLGETPPSPAQINTRASTAIDRFLAVTTIR